MVQHNDFSVVATNSGALRNRWQWEIHRAGRRTPIEYSSVHFETVTQAKRAGQTALRLLLSEYPAERR